MLTASRHGHHPGGHRAERFEGCSRSEAASRASFR